MDYDLGGWLWLIMDVLAVALLAAVIAYATMSYRRRYRAETPEDRSHMVDAERHAALARNARRTRK
jgi:hypothetical protein